MCVPSLKPLTPPENIGRWGGVGGRWVGREDYTERRRGKRTASVPCQPGRRAGRRPGRSTLKLGRLGVGWGSHSRSAAAGTAGFQCLCLALTTAFWTSETAVPAIIGPHHSPGSFSLLPY